MMFKYDDMFYKIIEKEMDEKIIMPLIIEWTSPKSVIDLGCAEGAWLREVLHQDPQIEILGVDGDYIKRERLKIPVEKFMAADLQKPIVLERKFDLAISTEVAEHLEERFINVYLDNIAKASEQVLFSAAVPGQGGTNHVNEQWQSYWIEKFMRKGYHCDYSIRDYFWDEERINSWRRQNLLFFSKKGTALAPAKQLKNVIHPEERIRIEKDLERKFEDDMRYFISHPEVYIKLEQTIKRLLAKNKKIVIYPYGRNGRLCEQILYAKYNVKEYIIADNKAVIEGKRIYRAEELEKQRENICVIDTCGNELIHEEVLEEIQQYVEVSDIYTVF